jgi:ring-1,2-phenylacetyl-CoA epoxidase subunit PaaC
VPAEDALAFFREAHDFRNLRLVEAENGDFGETMARLLVFSTARLALLEALRQSGDHVLAAVAEKGVKEVAYHRDYSARWFLTLARGTDESRRRVVAGLAAVWPYVDEAFAADPVETRLAEAGVGVDPGSVRGAFDAVLDQVLAVSRVDRPDVAPMAAVRGRTGRQGLHTEALSRMLATMQVVARAHPEGRW